MDLHTLAAVVDDELSGRRLSIPPSTTMNVQPNKPVAVIPDNEKIDERIDIKDLSTNRGPVRKRSPRSDEGLTKINKEVHANRGEDDSAKASKSNGGTYKDYCNTTEDELRDPASLIYASSASAKESPFPCKLHRILSNPDFQDVIAWLPHGRSWRVLKPKAFEERVIPLFFRHCRYSSFMRQVNGWGFQRVHQGPDVNSYYNELFLRGMPQISLKMRRPSAKEMKARTTLGVRQDAPDFYKISEKNPLPEYDFAKKSGGAEKDETNDQKVTSDISATTAVSTEPSSAASSVVQPQQQQQVPNQQEQLEANALPQLLGLAALQEKQQIAQQLLSAQAAQGTNASAGQNTLAAFLGGSFANAVSSPHLANTLSSPQQQSFQPPAQQIDNVALLQILAAQQEQQRQQQVQQQQQLALLQSMGLLGQAQGTSQVQLGTNAAAGGEDEVNKLRAALAASQMQNQIMAAALISKQPQS